MNGQLVKGVDPGKDQSYFLYTLKGEILKSVLFPVGGLHKKELREIARKSGLPTAEKKDSTGICFIGKRDFKEFLGKYIQYHPGEFRLTNGTVVGKHDGAAYYTIGQRKGMGLGGPGEPWFVVGKEMSRNIVYVEQGAEHPALYCDELWATELSFVNEPPVLPFVGQAKVRYRQGDQECVIESIEEGRAYVRFKVPQRAVTLRQSVVFYDNGVCLGGGMIESAGKTYHERGLALPDIISG